MKHFLILSLLAVPSLLMAQSEWEAPVNTNAQTTTKVTKEKKVKLDPKYGVGTVPVVDGKVEWQYNISMPGKSADQLFEQTLQAVTDLTKEPCQKEESRISAVNKKDHIIAAHLVEELLFSNAMLARDATDFRYTFIATCTDGNVNLRLCRISYAYEMHRSNGAIYSAEEWITDEQALNKKRTNTYRLNGKFRKKTIDRKDIIFQTIEDSLKK